MLIRIFITALSIIIGFRILYVLNKKLPYPSKIKRYVSYSLPVFELLLWIGFIIWFARDIYESNNYFGLVSFGVIFILLIISTFFLLRDFLAGVYLKLQNRISEGSFIEFEGIKGKIGKIGHFSLDIIDSHSDIKTIPYYKIRSKIISKHGNNPNLERIILEFSFPEQNNTIKNIIPKLKQQIMSTPWVAVSQSPVIENVKHENNRFNIIVGVYTLKNSYAENIKEMVIENMMKT